MSGRTGGERTSSGWLWCQRQNRACRKDYLYSGVLLPGLLLHAAKIHVAQPYFYCMSAAIACYLPNATATYYYCLLLPAAYILLHWLQLCYCLFLLCRMFLHLSAIFCYCMCACCYCLHTCCYCLSAATVLGSAASC